MAHTFARELRRTMTEAERRLSRACKSTVFGWAPALTVGLISAFAQRRPPSVSSLRHGEKGYKLGWTRRGQLEQDKQDSVLRQCPMSCLS